MRKFLHIFYVMLFLIGIAFTFASFFEATVQAVTAIFAVLFVLSLVIPYPGNALHVIALQNLDGPDGTEDNIGGTKKVIYVAIKSDFTTITEPVSFTTATTFAELAENTVAFTFVATKHFWKIYCTADTGKLMYKEQGEEDGKSYEAELEFFYPGSKAAAMGFMRYAKNNQWIVIVPLADGTMHQLGTADFPANIAGEFDSSNNKGGRRGTKFKVSVAVASGPIIYTGAVALA